MVYNKEYIKGITMDYKNILKNLPAAIVIAKIIHEADGEISDFIFEYTNDAFKKITRNLLPEGTIFSHVMDKLSKDVNWLEHINQAINEKKVNCVTFYSLLFSIWIKVSFYNDNNDYMLISVSDLSKEKEQEQQLRRQNLRLASLTEELSFSQDTLKQKLSSIEGLNRKLQYTVYHDAMTGLYNREFFTTCIETTISKDNHADKKFGVLSFNIDNLKNTNESNGHKAGDAVINKCAQILKRFEDSTTLPFRFTGDDFLILRDDLNSIDEMNTIGNAILSTLNKEGIKASGGIAIFPNDSDNADELLKFSGMALTNVKKTGKNRIEYFQKVMQDNFLTRLSLETKLSDALAKKHFQLFYQPQFDIKTNELRGFEALLRWYDEEIGWISPDQFIPLAEENRIIIPLGDWVLETAIATLKKWEEVYNFTGIISVNVSPIQLKRLDFIPKLFEKIERYQINPKCLEIEITEGVMIDNVDQTIQMLKEIRESGVGLSLDDFGTGFSSLRYLQALPITTLKIDKSFITNINNKNAFETDITDSIISMVSKRGIDTIAEGVENREQLDVLKKFNCRTIQGFLKGKPMPVDICEQILSGDTKAIQSIENGY